MTEKKSEGEFKKRLIRLEMFDVSTNENERDLVDSKQVLKILEDAKKEFTEAFKGFTVDPQLVQKLMHSAIAPETETFEYGFYMAYLALKKWFGT